ncbi:MAG TPA: NAD(P)-dependent oxidoreductase [Ohtaekwangia sp.]|nr:NAD(P)-dependent oxidoreductase [Ohtaekwangia sp.]
MKTPVCLVVDSMHESLFSLMDEIGWKTDYRPDITREQIKEIHRGYDGLIVRSKTTIDRELLGDTPTVRFIGRAGAGLDNLQLSYLEEKQIHVLHASEGNRDAVGEFTIGALLALMRKLPHGDRQVREYIWDREGNRGEEVMGKTVGIIGYGNMGQAFARRLKGFSCNVLAYDKYKTDYSDEYAIESTRDRIFQESDILSLHVPLTAETRNMVNREFFNRFRKRFILINTARGEIVSLADLNDAMEEGKVRGAVLDVLENERLHKLSAAQQTVFNSLQERSNVILTPHIAGWTFESHVKINVVLTSKIKALNLAF